MYDSRLGRFLSVDPLTKQYPYLTPYQFASNMPIAGNDLDGAENNLATLSFNPSTLGKAIIGKKSFKDIWNQGQVKFNFTMTGGAIGPITPGISIEFSEFNKFLPKVKVGTTAGTDIPTNSPFINTDDPAYTSSGITLKVEITRSNKRISVEGSSEGNTDDPDPSKAAIVNQEGIPDIAVPPLPALEKPVEGTGPSTLAKPKPYLDVPSFGEIMKKVKKETFSKPSAGDSKPAVKISKPKSVPYF